MRRKHVVCGLVVVALIGHNTAFTYTLKRVGVWWWGDTGASPRVRGKPCEVSDR